MLPDAAGTISKSHGKSHFEAGDHHRSLFFRTLFHVRVLPAACLLVEPVGVGAGSGCCFGDDDLQRRRLCCLREPPVSLGGLLALGKMDRPIFFG